MKKKYYTAREVESIVESALQDQLEELNKQKEMEDIWDAIKQLQEDIDNLKNNKVGF